MTRLLVIGASGFVGFRLCDCAKNHYSLFGTYNKTYINLRGCEFCVLDITDKIQVQEVITLVKPDIIIISAGTRDIVYCESYPDIAYAVHVEGTRNIVDACQKNDSRVIYLSTDCVFRGDKEIYDEDDTPNPINIYGQVKYEGEKYVLSSKSNAAVIRVSLLFGWCLPGQGVNTVFEVVCAAREQNDIFLPTTLYNTPLFIQTAAEAILRVANSRITGVYHLGGGCRVSRYDLGVATANIFQMNSACIHPTESSSGLRPKNSCLRSHKLQEAISWHPRDYLDGLKEMSMEPEILPGIILSHIELQNQGSVSAKQRRL